MDDCNSNKTTLPETIPKIPSVESDDTLQCIDKMSTAIEDISVTSADVIPKVKPDDDYIVVVAVFLRGTYKARRPINILVFMREETIDLHYNKYLFGMNLLSDIMGNSQDEPPLPPPSYLHTR